MARVTGIGGVFFRAQDPKLLAEWYERHLGIDDIAKTVWRQDAGLTVFSPFAQDTDYFGRDEQQWMVNFPGRVALAGNAVSAHVILSSPCCGPLRQCPAARPHP